MMIKIFISPYEWSPLWLHLKIPEKTTIREEAPNLISWILRAKIKEIQIAEEYLFNELEQNLNINGWEEGEHKPDIISGARYSCVPTNDIDRTSVGSTTSSGRVVVCGKTTTFSWTGDEDEDDFFRSEVRRNLWLIIGTQDWSDTVFGSTVNSINLCRELRDGIDVNTGDMTRVGETTHRNDKSKSESMMCPSARTSTFSGFKSLYTTPIMCRYSSASSTSAA